MADPRVGGRPHIGSHTPPPFPPFAVLPKRPLNLYCKILEKQSISI